MLEDIKRRVKNAVDIGYHTEAMKDSNRDIMLVVADKNTLEVVDFDSGKVLKITVEEIEL